MYGHPAADGRSRGAALSDLFWYWLSPGPEVHQEHLEPGPRYDDVARTTRQILAGLSRDQWAELVGRRTRRVLDELHGHARVHQVRLRDLMMPVWAEVYYEVVFREPCPRHVRDLITGNANDVVSALKCTGLRHGPPGPAHGVPAGTAGERPPPVPLPSSLTAGSRRTTSRARSSTPPWCRCRRRRPICCWPSPRTGWSRTGWWPGGGGTGLPGRGRQRDAAALPALRVAHRITSGEIPAPGRTPSRLRLRAALQLPRVPGGRWRPLRPGPLAEARHQADRLHPVRGDRQPSLPGAWFRRPHHAGRRRRGAAPLPAGVLGGTHPLAAQPRPLPARRAYRCGGAQRDPAHGDAPRRPLGRGPRSLTQLVLGSYMVWDARRQGLCRNYFAASPGGSATSVTAGR